jgi:peptide chain release factor subunit 1
MTSLETHAKKSEVETLRLRRLLKTLEAAHGEGTSMITVVIPAGGSISRMAKKLNEEYSTSFKIKNRL